jgi:hypothetical protein
MIRTLSWGRLGDFPRDRSAGSARSVLGLTPLIRPTPGRMSHTLDMDCCIRVQLPGSCYGIGLGRKHRASPLRVGTSHRARRGRRSTNRLLLLMVIGPSAEGATAPSRGACALGGRFVPIVDCPDAPRVLAHPHSVSELCHSQNTDLQQIDFAAESLIYERRVRAYAVDPSHPGRRAPLARRGSRHLGSIAGHVLSHPPASGAPHSRVLKRRSTAQDGFGLASRRSPTSLAGA